MAENEVAPCALCLQVDELPSMLEVQLPPSAGEPGMRRRLCAGCVSSIEAAMSESERWAKTATLKRRVRAKPGLAHTDAGEALESADASKADSLNSGGDQEAKVSEALE